MNTHEKQKKNANPMLYDWYIADDMTARGNVTGHTKFEDSTYILTSTIQSIRMDEEKQFLEVKTFNTIYHCLFAYLNFEEQDKYPFITKNLPFDYEKLAEKYRGKSYVPSIEDGNILLVLADFCRYYFHSVYFKENGKEKTRFAFGAHIGTFQDSFWIRSLTLAQEEIEEKPQMLDLRYLPHPKHINFYVLQTENHPLYIENIGNSTIYCSSCTTFSLSREPDDLENVPRLIELKAGERKRFSKENEFLGEIKLSNRDLYPAVVLDNTELELK